MNFTFTVSLSKHYFFEASLTDLLQQVLGKNTLHLSNTSCLLLEPVSEAMFLYISISFTDNGNK